MWRTVLVLYHKPEKNRAWWTIIALLPPLRINKVNHPSLTRLPSKTRRRTRLSVSRCSDSRSSRSSSTLLTKLLFHRHTMKNFFECKFNNNIHSAVPVHLATDRGLYQTHVLRIFGGVSRSHCDYINSHTKVSCTALRKLVLYGTCSHFYPIIS